MRRLLAVAALLIAIPAFAQPDSDACQALLEQFDEIVAAIEEVCEPEPPCDQDGEDCGEEPLPNESCPDSDACIFASGFETGDTSEWDETTEEP